MDVELRITGMHCESCAGGLRRYLRSQPGVAEATVSYDRERGTVTTDGETDVDAVVATIERMGYDVEVVGGG